MFIETDQSGRADIAETLCSVSCVMQFLGAIDPSGVNKTEVEGFSIILRHLAETVDAVGDELGRVGFRVPEKHIPESSAPAPARGR